MTPDGSTALFTALVMQASRLRHRRCGVCLKKSTDEVCENIAIGVAYGAEKVESPSEDSSSTTAPSQAPLVTDVDPIEE